MSPFVWDESGASLTFAWPSGRPGIPISDTWPEWMNSPGSNLGAPILLNSVRLSSAYQTTSGVPGRDDKLRVVEP